MTEAERAEIVARLRSDRVLVDAGAERPWIYVSGPMSGGPGDLGPYQNARAGMLLGKKLWHLGWHPIVPHLNAMWEMAAGELSPGDPDGAGGWMTLDMSWLTRADAVLRRPGFSAGGNREVLIARELEIPVFFEAGRGGFEFGALPSALDMPAPEGLTGPYGAVPVQWRAPHDAGQDPWVTGVRSRAPLKAE